MARFHRAGKTLRVGAFGRGDDVASREADAVAVARSLAAYVRDNGLDGVDVNFEDFAAVAGGRAPGWLNSFHAVLVQELASPPEGDKNEDKDKGSEGGNSGGDTKGNKSMGVAQKPPLLPPKQPRGPLLTYSPPAVMFAGAAGEHFAAFFRGKQGQGGVARLLVQFYSANATYATSEAIFGAGTDAAPGRARIANLTQWDANAIVVQKPLQENQPGHLAADELGKAFCDANQRVNGLSVWRIDYRNTTISNEYLAAVRGYDCHRKPPPSPPPNPPPKGNGCDVED